MVPTKLEPPPSDRRDHPTTAIDPRTSSGGGENFLAALDNAHALRSSLNGLGSAGGPPSLDLMRGGVYEIIQRDRLAALAAARAPRRSFAASYKEMLSNLSVAGGSRLAPQAALQDQDEAFLRRLQMEGVRLQQPQRLQNLHQQILGNSAGKHPPLSPVPSAVPELSSFTYPQLLKELSRRTSTNSSASSASTSQPAFSSETLSLNEKCIKENSDDTVGAIIANSQSHKQDKAPTVRVPNNSTTSFDALLSVIGEGAAELEREKNSKSLDIDPNSNNNYGGNAGVGDTCGDTTRANSSLSVNQTTLKVSNSTPPAATRMSNSEDILQRLQIDALLNQRRYQGTATEAARPFLGGREGAPTASLGAHCTAREIPSAGAMMAVLEAMRSQKMQETAARERALRELMAQRALTRLGVSQDGPWAALQSAAMLQGHPARGLGGGSPTLLCHPSLEAPSPTLSGRPRWEAQPLPAPPAAPPTLPPTPRIDPKRALHDFLNAFGADGRESRKRLRKAIADTEESLAAIHKWDHDHGLRKCHSRTVVKTRQSRAKLKAFLAGKEPPRERGKKRGNTTQAQ